MSRSRVLGSRSRQRTSSRRMLAGVDAGNAFQAGVSRSTAVKRVGHVVAAEGTAAREHLIQHAAERPDVRALVDRLASPARAPCRRRYGDHTRSGHRRRRDRGCIHEGAPLASIQVPSPVKVQHLHGAIGPHFDVGRLQIAMDDARFVGGFERVRDLPCDRQRFVERNGSAGDPIRRVGPSTSSMTRARVMPDSSTPWIAAMRMIQRGQHLRFALESGETVRIRHHRRRQDLERDVAFQS